MPRMQEAMFGLDSYSETWCYYMTLSVNTVTPKRPPPCLLHN